MASPDRVARALTMRTHNQDVVEVNEAGYTLQVQADRFYIVDPDDKTKRMRFAVSGVTTGTDVYGGMRTVVDTGGEFATPVVLTAADSGKIYLLDDAAGLDFTLPAITASTIGMEFEFKLVTEVTSNSYRWTAAAGDLLAGSVVVFDKDVAEGSTEALLQIFRPDGSDDLVTTIAGADDTTGALVGGELTFTALTATKWWVSGRLVGDGSLATIFS